MIYILYILYIFFGLIIGFLFFYRFIFLRDNKNQIPEGDNIVSPASGKIISIQSINGDSDIKIRKGFFGKIFTNVPKGTVYYLINIFMSPFDVHFTKIPYDGKVIKITRSPGSFLAVNTLKAGLQNEKQEFFIDTKLGLMKIIQISGFLARRTRSFIKENTSLKKGEKLGIILLGSQTALLFPKKDFTLNIKIGDRVSAGETILCNIHP